MVMGIVTVMVTRDGEIVTVSEEEIMCLWCVILLFNDDDGDDGVWGLILMVNV